MLAAEAVPTSFDRPYAPAVLAAKVLGPHGPFTPGPQARSNNTAPVPTTTSSASRPLQSPPTPALRSTMAQNRKYENLPDLVYHPPSHCFIPNKN